MANRWLPADSFGRHFLNAPAALIVEPTFDGWIICEERWFLMPLAKRPIRVVTKVPGERVFALRWSAEAAAAALKANGHPLTPVPPR